MVEGSRLSLCSPRWFRAVSPATERSAELGSVSISVLPFRDEMCTRIVESSKPWSRCHGQPVDRVSVGLLVGRRTSLSVCSEFDSVLCSAGDSLLMGIVIVCDGLLLVAELFTAPCRIATFPHHKIQHDKKRYMWHIHGETTAITHTEWYVHHQYRVRESLYDLNFSITTEASIHVNRVPCTHIHTQYYSTNVVCFRSYLLQPLCKNNHFN